jgi:MFS family permease
MDHGGGSARRLARRRPAPDAMTFWYRDLNTAQRRTFWACFSGWGLDAMDTQMYSLSIPVLIALWGMSKGDAGILGTAVLVMSAFGGWIAGILADRLGRVRVLQLTIVWFSVFTFLSGLTDNFWQLLATRCLQGLGFGGEWAVGSVLISEAIAPRVRGRVVGAIQAGWAVGYAIAVLVSTLIFTWLPKEIGWRVFFFLGIAPAFLVIWIRRKIEDAPVFLQAQRDQGGTHSVWDIFAPAQLRTTCTAVLLTCGIYGGNYVMIIWLPAYLKLALNLSIASVSGYLAINILGSFAGAFLNGWLADAIGRRKTFMLIACCQAVAVAIYTMAPIDLNVTLALGFVLGTLQSGTAAGTGAFLAELFPTRIRASAQGFCGNAGRACGAFLPSLVGLLANQLPLGTAMGSCACAAYGVVVLAAFLLPETRARKLDTMQSENLENSSDPVPVEVREAIP